MTQSSELRQGVEYSQHDLILAILRLQTLVGGPAAIRTRDLLLCSLAPYQLS